LRREKQSYATPLQPDSQNNKRQYSMLKKIILSLFSFVLIFGTFYLYAERPLLTQLSGKSTAPEFELVDLDDDIHTLKKYLGKPVVINFWATWCPPCRKEMPSMNRAWKILKDQGVEMIAIDVGEEDVDVYSFIEDTPIDFQILLDPNSESLSAWNLTGLPTTYILNTDGTVAYSATGGREWDDERIIKQILALKDGKPTEKDKPAEKKSFFERLFKSS